MDLYSLVKNYCNKNGLEYVDMTKNGFSYFEGREMKFSTYDSIIRQ